jgi:YidC/Oxa1 family membrane protein insertase
MDTKRLFTSMLIATAIMFGVMYFFRGGFGGGGGGASAAKITCPVYKNVPQLPALPGAGPERILTIGGAGKNDDFAIAVQVSNITAGIERVELNVKNYAADIKRTEPYTLFKFDPVAQSARPFATLGIHITRDNDKRELTVGELPFRKADGTIDLRRATEKDSDEEIKEANSINSLGVARVWKIVEGKQTPTDAVFSIDLKDNDKPLVTITKTFHVDPKTYDITVTHSVENHSAWNLRVAFDQTAVPNLKRDDPQSDDRFFHALNLISAKQTINDNGYNLVWGELPKRTAATGSDPVGGVGDQFYAFDKDPQLWVGSSNRFFAAIVRPLPETNAPKPFVLHNGYEIASPTHVAAAYIDMVPAFDKPNGEKPADNPAEDTAMVRLVGHAVEVAPNATVDFPLAVYLGPKDRNILGGSVTLGAVTNESPTLIAHAVYQYYKLLQFNTCFLYRPCAIESIAYYILRALDFIKQYIAFGNYGVAIMILVVIVRAILHPLTRMSQTNMAKLSKQTRDVAPQLEAMKKKYADNKKKQSEEMMRIYREHNINPAGSVLGCLPMLIQMPIWVALYAGLRADIDLRHMPFIPGWINDLASPDTIWPRVTPILGQYLFKLPLIGEIYGFNLLPILLIGVFYFQMKVSTASQPKPADEQQAQMQKMSQYMIFIFPLFLYNAPSGLNLYIFASTMAGLVDTYFVRKSLKAKGILAPSAPLLPTHEDDDKKS